MRDKLAQVTVQACEFKGLTLERYAYTPGSLEPLKKHSHEDYQLSLSFDCPGEYFYRGSRYDIPTHRLSVIHSGEPHAPSDTTYLPAPAHFLMAYIQPKRIQDACAEVTQKPVASLPYFPTLLPKDRLLNRLLLKLSNVMTADTPLLQREEASFDFLAYLVKYYPTDQLGENRFDSNRAAVVRSLDYLQAHYTDNISLKTLAAVAELSQYHFCRLFRKTVGVSPSQYQNQLRINKAKKLLLQGLPLSEVATATGFYDQSHFGKHFKRQTGVTPAKYTYNKL